MNTNWLCHRRAFSLIELLVTLAILGILSSLGVVEYQRYATKARIQSIVQAMKAYQMLLTDERLFYSADFKKKPPPVPKVEALDLEQWVVEIMPPRLTEQDNLQFSLILRSRALQLPLPSNLELFFTESKVYAGEGAHAILLMHRWHCSYKTTNRDLTPYFPSECKAMA